MPEPIAPLVKGDPARSAEREEEWRSRHGMNYDELKDMMEGENGEQEISSSQIQTEERDLQQAGE